MAAPELVNKAAYEMWVNKGRGTGIPPYMPEIFQWWREQVPESGLNPALAQGRPENLRPQLVELLSERGVHQVDRGRERWGEFWALVGAYTSIKIIENYGKRKIDEAHSYVYRTQLEPDPLKVGNVQISGLPPVSVEVRSIGKTPPKGAQWVVIKVPEIEVSRGYLALHSDGGVLRGIVAAYKMGDYDGILRRASLIDYRQFGELADELTQKPVAA